MPTLTGTLGDDTLTGTSGNDIIDGLDGNDLISGGDGNDQITGGLGDDTLFGEGGDDFVGDVDGGNDVLHGGAGNDSVTLYHIEFNRTETALLTGDDGNDYITDWSYAAGSVSIDAGSGDDTVLLYSSSHSIDVGLGSGRDILSLEPFQPHWSLSNTVREVFDFETGAAGDSVLLYNLLSNYGEWDGKTNPFETGVIRLIQRGSDTVLQLSGLMSVADFQDLLIFRGKTVGSFLAENFGGFSPNGIAAAGFTLTGDATDNVLTGGYGVDVIDGLGGTDRLVGLAGNDTLRGGDGMDFIYAGYGDDRVEGGAGDDFIDMQHDGGSDVIDAGTGNDSIIIYRNFRDLIEDIAVTAGDGDDTLTYQNFDIGSLTVSMGSGADRLNLWGSRQDIVVALGAGADIVDLSNHYATMSNETTITLKDFAPGEDQLIWGNFLKNELLGWNGSWNPITTGHLQIEQQGSDLVVWIDRDGWGFDFGSSAFLVLENQTIGALKAGNLPSFDPNEFADARNDFNGDGRTDLIMRGNDGSFAPWFGRGWGGFMFSSNSYELPAGWELDGTGDFNGDHRSDIVWRDASGLVTQWLGQTDGTFSTSFATYQMPADWHIAAASDLSGDGRADLIWRSDSGTVMQWLGQANGSFAASFATYQMPLDWHVQASADLNGDHRADLIWRSDSGTVMSWLGQTNGSYAASFATYQMPLDWQIQGTGDFNGDGRSDIAWRHESGTLMEWLGQSNGSFAASYATYQMPTDYRFETTGDFNGDGRDDILWSHESDVPYPWYGGDQLIQWLGQADGSFSESYLRYYEPLDWHLQSSDGLI